MSETFPTGGTIAAIATAVVPQQGSVGIVRVSGSASMAIAHSLFHAPGRQAWSSHRILYYQNQEFLWLRWWDLEGNLLLIGHERAEQESQRAEQAEARAARLAERLQAMGVDLDAEDLS